MLVRYMESVICVLSKSSAGNTNIGLTGATDPSHTTAASN